LTAAKTFLPGIGFRRAGTQLATPVSVTQGQRTLTVLRLIATPDATDLAYELTHLPNHEGTFPTPQRHGMDAVSLVVDGANYGVGGGMNISVRQGKLVRTFSMVPLPEGTTHLELHVSGPSIGEWNAPLALVPFPGPDEARYREVNASDTHHGVTVTARGIVASATETALDLIVMHADAQTRVWGLGGLHMRDETTALRLRDDKGRMFVERFRNDARDQFPDPSGIADVAIFEPLPDDSDELTVEVPCVCFEDHRPSLDVDLPVETPIETRLGDYPILIRGSRADTITRGGRSLTAVILDVDLGDVEDELCLINPTRTKADGKGAGGGWGEHGIYAPSPTPIPVIEIYYSGDTPPKRVTLQGATVRARGPWRISFARPR